MFEISEAMRAILVTRIGVDSFNDALAEADIPYRLHRVDTGFLPTGQSTVHVTSLAQVRLLASDGDMDQVDLPEGEELTVEEIPYTNDTSARVRRLVNVSSTGPDSIFAYDPYKGTCVSVVNLPPGYFDSLSLFEE